MFAIINATVEPVTSPRVNHGTVIVKNGKIASVGTNIKLPEDIQIIDARGSLLTPGLMDAHSHAGLWEDGSVNDGDVNEKSHPVTPQLRALDAFRPSDPALIEAAQSGVTSIFVTPGSTNVFCGLGAVVKTAAKDFNSQIVKPDAGLKMATGENPKRAYGSKMMPFSRMGTAAIMRSTFTKASIYAQKKIRAKKKKNELFEIDCDLDVICGLTAGNYPARCHAHRAIDMLTTMRIADEFKFKLIFEHATECEHIMEELVKRKIPVVIGPTFGSRTKIEVQHKRFDTVAAAVSAGLLVAITADHSVSPLRYLNVYAALAIREGLSETDALKCITINPAIICGVENRLGSIEKGKDADLVLWNGDPFDVRTKPHTVWINGNVVDQSIMTFPKLW